MYGMDDCIHNANNATQYLGSGRQRAVTYLLATLAILPLLIPQNGGPTLLGSNTLGLLERLTECACSDLAVFVKPIMPGETLAT